MLRFHGSVNPLGSCRARSVYLTTHLLGRLKITKFAVYLNFKDSGINLKIRFVSIQSLTPCCFVVYSTRRFVVCLSVCHFVLVFFSPFSIAITSLGEERANLSAFRTFVRFVLV